VESLRLAIEAGADLLQHGNLTSDIDMPDETLKTIATRSLAVGALMYTERQHAWIRENGSEWIRTFIVNETTDQNNRRLIEAGARLLLATDGFALGPLALNHPLMAGLLILEADPLADVRNYRRIVDVMKDGALVDRAALPTRRILSER
jgi:imidazolonepropionase-like amidohydrolase